MNDNNTSKFYNINELKEKYKFLALNMENNQSLYKKGIFNSLTENNFCFQFKIFRKMQKEYFYRTPESDSLYRRRNRLIILIISGLFYYKTSYGIFQRTEVEILSKGSLLKKISIPLVKGAYFFACILLSQLFMKYLYYLNKTFKSYQFALEGVLKYNIIRENYKYQGDREDLGNFDIVDSENIKKNQ
jgi:hypothetical protein